MDNSSGIYQAWTVGPIDVDPPGPGPDPDPDPVFQLSQNRPNPFYPSTTFEFRLIRAGEARLEILDAAGRRVATPHAGPLGSGLHEVSLDASGWPSGVYFYRLESGDGVAAGKMVLLER